MEVYLVALANTQVLDIARLFDTFAFNISMVAKLKLKPFTEKFRQRRWMSQTSNLRFRDGLVERNR